MHDVFTVVSRGWHGHERRRVVLAADRCDAVCAHREHYPEREITAVIAGMT